VLRVPLVTKVQTAAHTCRAGGAVFGGVDGAALDASLALVALLGVGGGCIAPRRALGTLLAICPLVII
jgi:hypothetical protein